MKGYFEYAIKKKKTESLDNGRYEMDTIRKKRNFYANEKGKLDHRNINQHGKHTKIMSLLWQ